MPFPSAVRLSRLSPIITIAQFRSASCFHSIRCLQTGSTSLSSSSSPRHFLSIADLSAAELSTLVSRASQIKNVIKSGNLPTFLQRSLTGKTVAILFSKRSTRTRVSTEAAVVHLGGHPMFLGKDDIQLGVCLYLLIQCRQN